MGWRPRAATFDLRAAFSAHGGELLGFARRALGDEHSAEEAVQETFLKAWRARARFDPELADERSWLFAILRNVITDQHRRRATRPRVVDAPDTDAPDPDSPAYEDALLSWQVEEALRRLSPEHRTVLLEVRLRDRPIAEVAAELGIPEGTVRSRLYYALRALRVHLEEMGWEERP